MALATTTNWEVRTTGAADNGGGFDPVLGASATDYSQQDAAELSLADGATTIAGSTTLESTTGGFTEEMVGNVLYVASGTKTDVGYYQITAYTDTNTVTIDRSPGIGTVEKYEDVSYNYGIVGKYNNYAGYKVAQSITPSDDWTIASIGFYATKTLSPTGSLRVSIQTDSTWPTGTLVDANATVDTSSIEGAAWYKLDFPDTFVLSNGVKYWIVWESVDTQTVNDTGWSIAASTSTPLPSGNAASYDGSWGQNVQWSTAFRLYDNVPPTDINLKVGGASTADKMGSFSGGTAWVKKGDYTAGALSSSVDVKGYNASRGDNPTDEEDMPTFNGASLSYVNASYIVSDGASFDASYSEVTSCISKNSADTGFSGVANIFRKCIAYNCGTDGFDMPQSHAIDCLAYGCTANGFHANGYRGHCTGCVAHDNVDGFAGIADSTMYSNACIAYDNTGKGFNLVAGQVWNCIAYNNDVGFAMALESGHERPTSILNSIALTNTTTGFYFNGNGSAVLFDHCCYYNNGTDITFDGLAEQIGPDNIDADPLFVDAANGDFRLQNGSPCLNTGVPQSPLVGGEVI